MIRQRDEVNVGRHILGVLVENRTGALARIAGLFAGRGFNIASLSVAETLDPSISRMTIVTEGDLATLEQVVKQLNRVIDVIKVLDYTQTDEPHLERELMLLKVALRPEILQVCETFRAKVVDLSHESCTIEVTGHRDKLEAIISLLKPIGIQEVVRTGKLAISRGPRTLDSASHGE